jgi:hypothetical protein
MTEELFIIRGRGKRSQEILDLDLTIAFEYIPPQLQNYLVKPPESDIVSVESGLLLLVRHVRLEEPNDAERGNSCPPIEAS